MSKKIVFGNDLVKELKKYLILINYWQIIDKQYWNFV